MGNSNVRVGIGVFVFKDGKFLMGQRKNSHGHGEWSVPGGHQEFGESPDETSHREVMEETSLVIQNVRFGAMTNDLFNTDRKHYVTLWMTSDYKDGVVTNMEPEKCAEWDWFDFDALPAPLFQPWQQLLKSEFIENIKDRLVKSKHA
jgi:8-oxo-dGTP diphosphatase